MTDFLTPLEPLLKVVLPALFALLGVLVGARLATSSQERLAALDREHRLRLAALEKRLEKHQEAYSLWWGLMAALHTARVNEKVLECQAWWASNCIWLSPAVADRFAETYQAANNHGDLVSAWRADRNDRTAAAVKDNFAFIRGLGQQIQAAVRLPEVAPSKVPIGASPFGDA